MIASSAARSFGLGQQPLRLVEEARVLERDAQARGQRRQQADVRLAERVRPVDVLERDGATDRVAGDERGEDHRLRVPRRCTATSSPCLRQPALPVLVDDDRLARLDDRARASPLIGTSRSASSRSPRSSPYGNASSRRRRRRATMSHDLGVEDLLDLVADQVVHRLHVELGGEALLDAVDDRQLGRALVRSRSGGAASRRTAARSRAPRSGSTASVVRSRTSDLAEGVVAVEVLERDPTDDARRRRSAARAASTWAARPGRRATASLCAVHASTSSMHERLARLENGRGMCRVGRSAIGSSGKRSPRSMRVRVARSVSASRVVDADVDHLGVEDLLDLVADQVVHRLHVELLRRAPPGRC